MERHGQGARAQHQMTRVSRRSQARPVTFKSSIPEIRTVTPYARRIQRTAVSAPPGTPRGPSSRRAIWSSVWRSSSRIARRIFQGMVGLPAKSIVAIATRLAKLERPMHAAEQPAKSKCNGDRGIWLLFDCVAQRLFERAGRLSGRPLRAVAELGRALARMIIEIGRRVGGFARDIARLLPDIAKRAREITARSTGVLSHCAPRIATQDCSVR